MNFAEFRKKNEEQAPHTAETSQPADAKVANGETEKEHQNKDLLKMKGDKTVWIPRGPKIQAPGLSDDAVTEAKSHHKVKIHFGNGKTEERLVDDDELGVIKRNQRVTKVVHLGRSKANGKLIEYVLEEANAEVVFKHKDGRKAIINSYKYADPSLGVDHYVHIQNSRATVYPGDEGLNKAHKLLKKLGFQKAE
jgi:hypothetical protein